MAKYLRKDYENGFMSDNVLIEYYKKTQEIDVINNLLIGDYNSKGEYVTSKEVLKELLDMPKYILKTFNTNMYLQSNAELGNFNQLTFMVTVQDGVPKLNMSRASLLLTEEVSKCAGYYTNTNSVVLDTFEDINDLDFNDKMFKHFNIVENNGRKPAKSDIPLSILNRKTTLNDVKQGLFSAILGAQKDFLTRRLSVLKRYEIGQKIVKEYSGRLTEIKIKLASNDPQFIYCQNELLDMILEETDYKKDRAFKKAIDECYAYYSSVSQSFKTLKDVQNGSTRTKIKETLNS